MLRIWSLKVIGKLLQLSPPKKKEKLIQYNVNNQSINRLLLVKNYLEKFTFNETTYFALLEVLVECVNNREFKNPLQNEEQEFFLKNPVIISIIFEMLCTSGQSNLQYKILQDFIFVLNQSSENKSIFVKQAFWQNWLLGLLANNSSPSNSSSEVFKQIVKLLTILFHHCLSEPNGWKVFSDSQGLLHYFGTQGFFDCVEITRDINTSMLRTIAYDARILQVTSNQKDYTTWENLIKWLSFTEECLFVTQHEQQQQQQQSSSNLPQDDHFLLGIHRRYDGMWIDFEFAQKLLDFLDSLLLTPINENGSSSIASSFDSNSSSQLNQSQSSTQQLNQSQSLPSVSSSSSSSNEENLIRLALRLILYTLSETDAFLNTEKIQERSKNLKNVESAVDDYFTEQELYPRVKEGLSNYLQGKIKQWNSEMNSVDKVFQKNIDRLRQLVQRLLKMIHNHSSGVASFSSSASYNKEKEINRLMYIISFLYRAMKRSYEHQGIGAELILNVFKEILISCRPMLPLSAELTTMNEDQFVEFFMRHFAFPQENLNLFKRFDDGVKQILLEEQQYANDTFNQLQQIISNICKSVQIQHQLESDQIQFLQHENLKILEFHRTNENERLIQYNKLSNQTRRSLIKKTKSILNELSHERGPWATPESIDKKIYWKLSKVETQSRKRLKLTRNRNFNSHEQCAKGIEQYEALIKSQSDQNQNQNTTNQNINNNLYNNLHVSTTNLSKPLKTTDNNNNNNDDDDDHGEENLDLNDDSNKSQKLILECSCDLITPLTVTRGNFEITTSNLYFMVSKSEENEPSSSSSSSDQNKTIKLKKQTSRKWSIRNIKYIHARRYLLRNHGLEIFFSDHRNYFLNFESTKIRDLVWRKIMSLKPPNLIDFGSGGSISNLSGFGTPPSGSQLLKRMNIITRWKNREISNFDYLMWLNTLAGRTYNDLTQYPIFPWILKDYESETIDLNDESIYRDLSKPMGALNPDRLSQFIERFNAFDDPTIPKFHYGSHYSNVGIVLYYLLRLEPFTSYFLTMQGGKFDHPTRMFMSIIDTWKNCLTNSSDVKELIPEFFYLPEFLENSNDFCFGFYNGQEVRFNVELPKWASSSIDFITKHREALESDYVSNHLHEWIDLIFGYKQRGIEAENSYNLFYYLTYEGVIDIDSIDDPIERKSIESQIINFGQTPSQLFDKPHPKRKLISELNSTKQLLAFNKQIQSHSSISPFYDLSSFKSYITKPIIFIQYCSSDNKLVFITMDGIISINSFIPKIENNRSNFPFIFEMDKNLQSNKNQKRLDMIYPEPIQCPSRCFIISKDCKCLFSCGMWNDDIQARSFSNFSKFFSAEHRDIVNCLAMTSNGQLLVSGSNDCTVVVWQINTSNLNQSNSISSFWNLSKSSNSNKSSNSSQIFKVKQILYGHTDSVTSVDVSFELDLVISASNDKSIILYNLNSGKFLRSISLHSRISQVTLSCDGYFVAYCDDSKSLSLYTINGVHLNTCSLILARILISKFTPNGKYFVSAGVGNVVIVRKIPSFKIVYIFEVPCAVLSLDFAIGPELSFLLIALMNSQIRVIPFDTTKFIDSAPTNNSF